jgi:hypothetical protein
MNGLNGGVAEAGQDQRFFAEALASRLIERPGRNDLERKIAFETVIVRAVHHAHAAGAQLFNDGTAAKRLANQRRHIARPTAKL